MMQLAKRVILAGSESELTTLADSLKDRGVEVELCADGTKALEKALTWTPSLMVLDTAISLIPVQRLYHILCANPKTQEVAVNFIGAEGENIEGFRRHRDRFISRPFNSEQVFGSILGYLNRKEQAEQVGRQKTDIEGKLSQVPLVDLLQIFGHNRKDGVLYLADGERRGEIHLLGGHVANAHTGSIEGSKAFFRLLTWSGGEFWFAPEGAGRERRILTSTEHLILEGMRQADEMKALRQEFPAGDGWLRLAVEADKLPRGLRPATQEVLLTLQYYQRLEDVLDNCSQSDFEVLQILRVLIDKGLIRFENRPAPDAVQDEPLLSAAEVLAIKERLGEQELLLEEASVKLVILSDSVDKLGSFAQRLAGLAEFSLDAEFQRAGSRPFLGDLGVLTVSDTFSLRLLALPLAEQFMPLWSPLKRRLLGVVSLTASEGVRQAEEFFQLAGNIPVIRVNVDDTDDKGFPESVRDRGSLKRLLGFFAAFYSGKMLSEDGE